MFRTLASSALAIGTGLAGLAIATPAQAVTTAPKAQHCVVSAETGASLGCYTSLAAADRAGSTERAPLLVLARLFDRTGYDARGATLTVKGSRACTASTGNLDLGLTNLGAFGFDNGPPRSTPATAATCAATPATTSAAPASRSSRTPTSGS